MYEGPYTMSIRWEYLTTVVEANAAKREARSFLKARFPGRRRIPRFAPESLMLALDKYGQEGWELVHMEPVARVGSKGDILFPASGAPRWSRAYFCVFKRPQREQRPAAPPETNARQPTAAAPPAPPALKNER